MENELKNCPFCGKKPTCSDFPQDSTPYYRIACLNTACLLQVSVNAVTRKVALERWNTRAASSPPPAPAVADEVSDAARDVLNERKRQVEKEGWTTTHDDEHSDESLSLAAICYAAPVEVRALGSIPCGCRSASCEHWQGSVEAWINPWPWDAKWWKPKNRRENLVRAAALLLAEIERLDRLDPSTPTMRDAPPAAVADEVSEREEFEAWYDSHVAFTPDKEALWAAWRARAYEAARIIRSAPAAD